MKERIDRIDERGSRMAAEIHDERTARESAQRLIASQAHDTHRSIYERIEALESVSTHKRPPPAEEVGGGFCCTHLVPTRSTNWR